MFQSTRLQPLKPMKQVSRTRSKTNWDRFYRHNDKIQEAVERGREGQLERISVIVGKMFETCQVCTQAAAVCLPGLLPAGLIYTHITTPPELQSIAHSAPHLLACPA